MTWIKDKQSEQYIVWIIAVMVTLITSLGAQCRPREGCGECGQKPGHTPPTKSGM